MNNFWNYQVWNTNTVKDFAFAFGIAVAGILLLRLLQKIVVLRLKAFAAKSKTTIDDFIIRLLQTSVMPFLYLLSVYGGIQYLVLPSRVEGITRVAALLVITILFLRVLTSSVGYLFQQAMLKHSSSAAHQKQSRGILLIINVAIWAVGLLFLIDNLGYDITTLVAGLGIGGIAIALAAQTVLGDLFSYFVIYFDKPFEIGDFIIVDDKMGTVEYVGIKTTRIKTLGGEQLICSNTDLTNARVHNYKRMNERRVVFSFGVVYSTPAQKLKMIPGLVKQLIEGTELTRFDRAHFSKFGDSSLDFEVVYYVLSPDYNQYMDIQQSLNMRLFERFEKDEIEFAFPSHTIYFSPPAKEKSLNGTGFS